MLHIDVVWTGTHHGRRVGGLLEFGFHAAEGNVGFGDFILVVDLKIVAAWVRDEVPGPTLWFDLVGCLPLSLRNTNAIKFIIMSYFLQLTK